MAKAKKLPSGSWRCLAYSHNEPVYDKSGKAVIDPKTGKPKMKRVYESFTNDTKALAEYDAAAFALQKKNRLRNHKTFRQALNDYIEAREDILSPRTIRDYKYIQKSHLQGLMDIKIDDLTQNMIQREINAEAAVLAPKTVRDHHGLICAVLKQERPDFALNTKLPKSTPTNLYIPSDSDVQKIIDLAAGTELEIPIMLAAFGPMRRGEICALTTDCIQDNTVHVMYNMVLNSDNEWIIKSPKTYSGDRYIEFPDFVIQKLKAKNGRITSLTPDALSCRFRRLIKRANVPHFRFHDLRHYSASIQHALGIPDAYIMQRGGWKNDGILKSVYRHTMDQQQKAMNDKANAHFSEICNTKSNTKK